MKTVLQNLVSLPGILLSMAIGLWRQKRFMRKSVSIDLEIIQGINDGSLNDSDFKKITHYYAFAVPAVLGEAFGMLTGKKMSKKERMALTYQGALTGLFDDFFDEKKTDENHILTLFQQIDEQQARNMYELLFVRFCKKAISNAENVEELLAISQDVYQVQIDSQKQKDAGIDEAEIFSITKRKGGLSLLFYRIVLERPLNAEERDMTYKLGSLLQLENDIFDVYKDHQINIKTLPTTLKQIAYLRAYYNDLIEQTLEALRKTSFPPKNKRRFARFIMLLVAKGSVCLDCLERNEATSDGVFDINNYNRKMLICDMEKIRNSWATLIYYLKTKVN